MRPARPSSFVITALVLASALGCATAGYAQADDPSPAARVTPAQRRPEPDFFFSRPLGAISFRSTFVFPRAGSDIYDFVTDQLTVNKRDFRAPGLAADANFAITPRLAAVGGFEFARSNTKSEYRHYVDNNSLPIEQRTALSTFALSGSLRYDLVPRGREVSHLAWIPRKVVPYVGAGGGATYYELKQDGDFVDYKDLSVFTDTFDSNGWAPTAHVLGGVDIQVHGHIYATIEGRYVWGKGDLGADFVDFKPIDLAGFRTTMGLSFAF